MLMSVHFLQIGLCRLLGSRRMGRKGAKMDNKVLIRKYIPFMRRQFKK